MHVTAALLSYPPARFIGSEMTTAHVLSALVRRGHTATAVVGDHAARRGWEYDGVTVVHRAHWRRTQRPNVVVCHADMPTWGQQIARTSRASLVAYAHNDRTVTRVALRHLRPALTVVSADWMQRSLERPDALVARPWVDTDVLQVNGDAVTLVNLTEDKGGDLFWRLAAALPDVPFLGVRGGYGVSVVGPPLSNVTVLPHIPYADMDDRVWSRTRLLLMPSKTESWGRTAIEAAARGIPVLAHPTPGLLESLGEAGVFLDREDPADWVDAITRLQDGRRWRPASRKALERARGLRLDADIDKLCDAIEALEGR